MQTAVFLSYAHMLIQHICSESPTDDINGKQRRGKLLSWKITGIPDVLHCYNKAMYAKCWSWFICCLSDHTKLLLFLENGCIGTLPNPIAIMILEYGPLLLEEIAFNKTPQKYPSLHPFSSAYLWPGSWVEWSKQGHPDLPLPGHLPQRFRVDPKVFPGRPSNIVTPACPGTFPRVSSWRDMPRTPPKGGIHWALDTDARAK